MGKGANLVLLAVLVVAAFGIGYYVHKPTPGPVQAPPPGQTEGGRRETAVAPYSKCPPQLDAHHNPHPMAGRCGWSASGDPKECDLSLKDLMAEATDPDHESDPACLIHASYNHGANVVITNDTANPQQLFTVAFVLDPSAPTSCQGNALFNTTQSQPVGANKVQELHTGKVNKAAAIGCLYHMNVTLEVPGQKPASADPHIAGEP